MNVRHGPITGVDTWVPLPETAEYRRRLQHATEVHVCVEGWVCEAHPDQGSPHFTFSGAACAGQRLPCPFRGCPRSAARQGTTPPR